MGPTFEVSVYERGSNHIDYVWIEKWTGEDLNMALIIMRNLKAIDSEKPVRLIWR